VEAEEEGNRRVPSLQLSKIDGEIYGAPRMGSKDDMRAYLSPSDTHRVRHVISGMD